MNKERRKAIKKKQAGALVCLTFLLAVMFICARRIDDGEGSSVLDSQEKDDVPVYTSKVLNQTITNEMSEIEELAGLDKKIKK